MRESTTPRPKLCLAGVTENLRPDGLARPAHDDDDDDDDDRARTFELDQLARSRPLPGIFCQFAFSLSHLLIQNNLLQTINSLFSSQARKQ